VVFSNVSAISGTLKELNLDGNFFHDEGAEQIANAISANRKGVLEKLYLGWNGVADDGAKALAEIEMIERDWLRTTLRTMELVLYCLFLPSITA
jgi:hypothetical protein